MYNCVHARASKFGLPKMLQLMIQSEITANKS